jgi:ubiquinone/menaquinone biosynthesis C-methylase UbiE
LAGKIKRKRHEVSWEVFNKLHRRYDEWFDKSPGREIFELELQCLKKVYRGVPEPWLEIGVGTGRFAERLGIVFGVDPSEKMLSKASRRDIKVVQGLAECLPFPLGSFGGLAMVVTLCFLDNPSEALREGFRVLSRGGALILGIVPRESSWGKFYSEKKREGHPFYSVAYFYSVQETIKASEEVGFQLEAVFSTLFEEPETCTKIRSYPPAPGWTKRAGFVCIKMRKP